MARPTLLGPYSEEYFARWHCNVGYFALLPVLSSTLLALEAPLLSKLLPKNSNSRAVIWGKTAHQLGYKLQKPSTADFSPAAWLCLDTYPVPLPQLDALVTPAPATLPLAIKFHGKLTMCIPCPRPIPVIVWPQPQCEVNVSLYTILQPR